METSSPSSNACSRKKEPLNGSFRVGYHEGMTSTFISLFRREDKTAQPAQSECPVDSDKTVIGPIGVVERVAELAKGFDRVFDRVYRRRQ